MKLRIVFTVIITYLAVGNVYAQEIIMPWSGRNLTLEDNWR